MTGEAIGGLILLVVLPILFAVVPAVVICIGIFYSIKKIKKQTSTLSFFNFDLGWRVPVFIYSLVTAVVSRIVARYFFDTKDVGFILGFGPQLVFFITAPLAVIALVFILAKILANLYYKKNK